LLTARSRYPFTYRSAVAAGRRGHRSRPVSGLVFTAGRMRGTMVPHA